MGSAPTINFKIWKATTFWDITYIADWALTGMAANPARGKLSRENKIYLSPLTPDVWLRTVCMYVCMYAFMVITCSKSMDQPGKVANPARGQLNKENEYFPVPVRA